MIRIEHLKKSYDGITPLKDVNAVIGDGEVISVIGPSGTGKSTLLRCINRLEEPDAGKIFLDDVEITAKNCDLTKIRRKIGFVFQAFNLYEHLTVLENVTFAQERLLGRSRQEAYDRAMEALTKVGLGSHALKYPAALSGGQKQRAAIARTVVMDPEVILFDEPTSALDPIMVGEVQNVIRNLALSGTTMMIVTHEMSFARKISSRIFYMDEGQVYEDGTPEQIFGDPQKEKTRQFVRRLSLLELSITKDGFDYKEAVEKIHAFLTLFGLGIRAQRRAEAILEEMAYHFFLPLMKQDDTAAAALEYSEKEEKLVFRFSHSLDHSPENGSMDELSLSMVRGMTRSIREEKTDAGRQIVMEVQGGGF